MKIKRTHGNVMYRIEHYTNHNKVNDLLFWAWDNPEDIHGQQKAHKLTKTTSWSDPYQWHGFMWDTVIPGILWRKDDREGKGHALVLTKLGKKNETTA